MTTTTSTDTMPPFLINAYETLGRELKSLVALYEGMETEQSHVNQVCNKMREALGPLPVMPNNPNIIQAGTRQIEELKKQRGNLGFAIMMFPGMTNHAYDKILKAESAAEIKTIMQVLVRD